MDTLKPYSLGNQDYIQFAKYAKSKGIPDVVIARNIQNFMGRQQEVSGYETGLSEGNISYESVPAEYRASLLSDPNIAAKRKALQQKQEDLDYFKKEKQKVESEYRSGGDDQAYIQSMQTLYSMIKSAGYNPEDIGIHAPTVQPTTQSGGYNPLETFKTNLSNVKSVYGL